MSRVLRIRVIALALALAAGFAYGPVWGFLFGWAGVLVILSGSVAAVAVGFAEYFSYFVPALGTDNVLVSVPGALGSVVALGKPARRGR